LSKSWEVALPILSSDTPSRSINIFNQDPACDLDYCANTARDMKIDVALKNNFGFGGTNGALVFKRI
jgi:3-oxoacyl-[acyl-carrier-protein] synthase II